MSESSRKTKEDGGKNIGNETGNWAPMEEETIYLDIFWERVPC